MRIRIQIKIIFVSAIWNTFILILNMHLNRFIQIDGPSLALTMPFGTGVTTEAPIK